MLIQLGTGIVYPLMSTIGGTYAVNMLYLNINFNLIMNIIISDMFMDILL